MWPELFQMFLTGYVQFFTELLKVGKNYVGEFVTALLLHIYFYSFSAFLFPYLTLREKMYRLRLANREPITIEPKQIRKCYA